jgi:urease accessory protein
VRRATTVIAAGEWNGAGAIDSIALDSDQRRRRRIVLTADGGTAFLLNLPHATMLRNGDGLLLDDGAIVRVIGRSEPLLEIGAADATALVRLAWYLGNRHVDVQAVEGKLRIRRDHVLEQMLQGLGARIELIEAPFDPEPGAYVRHQHGDDDG